VTGGQVVAVTAGVLGESAVTGRWRAAPSVPASSRSGSRCRRGKRVPVSAAHVVASVVARSSSSALVGGEPGQPALHAVEQLAVGQALPLLPAPGLGADEGGRPLADLVGGQHLAGGEHDGLVEVPGGALVAHAELGEPVHLVAPQVDADRGVGGGREHVDDGAAHGHLTAVLHQLLPAVPVDHQASQELLGVQPLAGPHHHGLHVLHVGAEPL
jgi:hypothetical protein